MLDKVLTSGTHFYPNLFWDIYKYNIGTQKITFDEHSSNEDAEYDRIIVEVGENGGQKAHIAISANYRVGWVEDAVGKLKFDPTLIVELHKDGIGKTYESVVLKRTVVEVVNEVARPKGALEIYSGRGFVSFANEVDTMLKNHPQLKSRGIYIENTIIYKVYLDEAYESEIASKQLAIQQNLTKVEQTKTQEQEAKRAFAEAQTKVEQARQTAEAKKITEVLAAEAEKQKRILEAEGERDANLAKASGVLAVGEAEAKVITFKTQAAYAGEAGALKAKVDITRNQAEVMAGLLNHINVLPEKAFVQIGETSKVVVPQDSDV